MKYCPFCGSGLDDEMVFCPKCGRRFRSAHESSEPEAHEIENPPAEVKETVLPDRDIATEAEDTIGTAIEQPAKDAQITPPVSHKKFKKPVIVGIIIAIIILAASAVLYVCFSHDKIDDSKGNVTIVDDVGIINDADNGAGDVSAAAKSVLFLETYDDDGNLVATASGFIARDQTTLITNYHVIDGAYRIVAFTPNKESSVEVKTLLAYDSVLDLAILECEKAIGVTPLVLGNSDTVLQGDSVYAVGYPLGVAHTLSDGVVGSRYIDDNGIDTIQITAAISNGSSGGALINESGEVVGVICASYVEGQNLNLAIASNALLAFMEKSHSPMPLSDYYAKNEAYGISQVNLAGGCLTVENEEYLFYVKDNFIYQMDKITGRAIEIAEGNCINLYKNKLYYCDRNINDIVRYNLETKESEYLHVFTDKQVEDFWVEGYYWFEEEATDMLIAEDTMFLSIWCQGSDGPFYYLAALDVNNPANVYYRSDFNINNFNYCNGFIYAGVEESNQILLLNIKTLEEEFIEAPCSGVVLEGADDNYFYFTDYWDLNGNVLYRGTLANQDGPSFDEIKFIKKPDENTYASYCVYSNEVYCFIRNYNKRSNLYDETGKIVPLEINYTSFCKFNSDGKIEVISSPDDTVMFNRCGFYDGVAYPLFLDEHSPFNLLTGQFQ